MRFILFLLLLPLSVFGATTYTEFYCDASFNSTNNLNSGSDTNSTPKAVFGNGTFVRSTGVFTPDSGNPTASNIVLNVDWASVYTTSGASTSTCVALITGTNGTTITLSTTQLGGATANVSETASASTLKVGGAWAGPLANTNFPFNFANSNMISASGVFPRINLRGGTTYAITTGLSQSLNGPIRFQGFTSTPGDGGKATIDCATVGASVVMLTTSSGINTDFADLIFSNSGATSGNSAGITGTGSEMNYIRVVVHDVRSSGFSLTGGSIVLEECEAYLCNKASTAQQGGFLLGSSSQCALRCISHDNTTANGSGFVLTSANSTLVSCIADSNGTNGVFVSSVNGAVLIGCDLYNNTGSGVEYSAASAATIFVENCNFIKNGQWGITSGINARNGSIRNCGFGSGTMANSSGNVNTVGGVSEVGSITYASGVNPWTDPANGDFRISLAAAKAAGRGAFTQTQASYTGTVGFPDVGAAQSTGAASASPTSYTFSQ